MPGFDERLRQHLERVAPPADPSGAFDRVLEKKIRRRLMRRAQAAVLAFVVVAGTVGGSFALYRAFRSTGAQVRPGGIDPTPGPVANGRIAYVSLEDGSSDIWTANPNGSGATNLTSDFLGHESAPAWSPDGGKIAFVSDHDGDDDIYVMDSEGAETSQLTDDPGSDRDPVWSPDGSKIAYVAGDDIHVMNADGSNATRLTSGPEEDRNPAWAPDGSRIVFAREVSGDCCGPGTPIPTVAGIYVVAPDGTEMTRLTKGSNLTDDWPDWSPDGAMIVFARAVDIHVMRSNGSGMTRITDSEEGTSTSNQPSWSPDGRKIVFTRVPAGESWGQIYTMNADGSGLTPTGIAEGASPVGQSDWQPIPAGSAPSSSPTAIPTPTASPLPARCDASQVTGDFEGDDALDLAVVAKTSCLTDPTDDLNTEYALHVRWFAPEGGPPAEGIAPLPDCKKACRALAAADLNGDGIDEFVLMVDKGASTDFFQVYELPASEAFGRPVIVAPPGGKDFPPGETAEFALFGSVTHFTAIGCDLIKHQVIVQAAVESSDPGRYSVHETLLRLETTENPPFAEFHVVSERDYTERVDEGVGVGDHFEPGDPCWMYGS